MTDTLIPEWTFGERLRKARDEAGLSTDDIARATGKTKRAVTSWESGERIPQFGELRLAKLYSEATGVDYEWLVTGRVRTGSR